MINISPPKSPTKLRISKNIRLHLNSKSIPEDFFPESISQYSRSRKHSRKETFLHSTPQSPENHPNNNNEEYSTQDLENINLLKKRLIKLKELSPPESESKNRIKSSVKKQFLTKKCQKDIILNNSKSQIKQNELNSKERKYSTKIQDYMQKMNKVININIKFEDDLISPTYKKRPIEYTKEDCDDIQTDDSPKLQRFRPKSEFSNRSRFPMRQSLAEKMIEHSFQPKGKEAKKLIKRFEEEKSIKLNNRYERYDKCGDLQLNEEGMLTFYGSFNSDKRLDEYDSRKYSTRSSLPKLDK